MAKKKAPPQAKVPKTPRAVVRAIRHRVPQDAPEEVKELADRALQRAIDVMDEKVDEKKAPSVLKAASMIREEICGSVPKDLHVQGTLSLEQLIKAASAPPKESEPA